ncbi:MAG: T9SS type A sorting domain-containing protein [candidate division KSB1 bacterium]|nr:T9SS type A sorting domain-containing protein [candidate division KSB1 bacterium]
MVTGYCWSRVWRWGATVMLLGGPLLAADLQRPYDPVVLQGRHLALFVGAPVANMRVYSYRADSDQWLPIPFQIDERDNLSTYFAPAYNGVLDSLDEVVFMASDAGDLCPEDAWVADAEARANRRYLVTVADTLDGLRQGYVYIYLSSSLATSSSHYVGYDSAMDLVTGVSYTIQNGVKGFADYLAINAAAGGDSLDFLDRQKFRLQVNVYGLNIEPFTEDHPWISLRRVDARAGAVRVIRSQVILFSGSVLGVSFTDSLKLTTFYYPYLSYMATGERSLVTIPNVSLRMLRFSYDLNSRAFGMIFYNPYNQAGNRINAIEAAGFKDTLLWPGTNWYLIVADPSYPGAVLSRASVLGVVALGGNPISDRYRLFFRDTASPESPNTGEDGSYGETGLILEDNDTMVGTLNLTYWSYYFPFNLSYQQAEQLGRQASAALQAWGVPEVYDVIPPARMADLGVVDVQQQSVTLSLTAPGDDGWSGGAATSYEVRYSTQAVGADTAAWWAAAAALAAPPQPGPPGQAQVIIIAGLQQSTTYYFVAVALDNVGNRSAYSNVATATTLPAPDNVPPARIADLAVVDVQRQAVTLGLTAPGDDGWSGGPASSYEVRYATEAVGADTAAWWATAAVFSAPPPPGQPGEPQTITVPGLQENTTYYFLVVAVDEVGNRSGYSNVAEGTTLPAPDEIPPARIADLAIEQVQDDYVTLSLTAPGDDGWLGGAVSAYEVRYSTQPVGADTTAWWEAATVFASPPQPVQPGLGQTITVIGLAKNRTYYFVVVALDDRGNRSPYSNVASATTLPVELASFQAHPGEGQVVLEWTTKSESNNYGFEVQRREGNGGEWLALGFVRGGGTTTRPRSYRFVDQKVLARTYSYRLKQLDNDGRFEYSPVVEVTVEPPSAFALAGNYPNPFNPGTEISYRIAKPADGEQVHVRLTIYNMLGQEIATLVDAPQPPGWYVVAWDGRDALGRAAGSGLYICRLQAGAFAATMKMLKMQ